MSKFFVSALYPLSIFVLAIVASSLFLLSPRNEKMSSLSTLNNCFPIASATSQSSGPDDECLKKRVDSLLETFSTKDLMNYVVASTTSSTVTNYCHDAAHIIGEETFIKVNNVETALSQCTRACNLGCIHGVIVGAVAKDLGAKYLNEDIVHADPLKVEELGAKYCAKGLCHAMGHILYVGSQNIQTSLHGCEQIGTGTTTAENCFQGVFMEAAGGENEFIKGTATSQRKDNDYAYPCDTLGARYEHGCLQHLVDFQKQLFAKNSVPVSAQFSIMRTTCESLADKKARSDCFLGIGYAFLHTTGKKDDANPYSPTLCESLSGIDQDSCVVGFALKNVLTDKYTNALNYCSGRSEDKRMALCYNAVFQTMKSIPLTDERISAQCGLSNTVDTCKQRFATFLPIASSLPQYYVQGLFR